MLELLEIKIKEMKDLQQLRLQKHNQDRQNIIDAKYKLLVSQASTYCAIYEYLCKELGFQPSDRLRFESRKVLLELKNAINNGVADKEAVNLADRDLKALKESITREWLIHYPVLTTNTINTLKIIGGIDADKVDQCLSDIKAANSLVFDKRVYQKLKNALDIANELIISLRLDPTVIAFLTKITAGNATVADLDETILAWVLEEHLESKIRLSFTSN